MLTLNYGSGLLIIKADKYLVRYHNNYFSIVCNNVHFSLSIPSVLRKVTTRVQSFLLSLGRIKRQLHPNGRNHYGFH